MKQLYQLPNTTFATAYGQCSYSTTNYNKDGQVCGTSTTAASGGGAASAGTGLANTGTMVLAFVGIASLILLAAMIIRVWRRPVRQEQEK